MFYVHENRCVKLPWFSVVLLLTFIWTIINIWDLTISNSSKNRDYACTSKGGSHSFTHPESFCTHTNSQTLSQNIICIIYFKLYFEGLQFKDALRKHSCLLLWCPLLCYTFTKLITKIKVMDPSLFGRFVFPYFCQMNTKLCIHTLC